MVESTKLQLEQVRSIVDENLETTLERRLGDRSGSSPSGSSS